MLVLARAWTVIIPAPASSSCSALPLSSFGPVSGPSGDSPNLPTRLCQTAWHSYRDPMKLLASTRTWVLPCLVMAVVEDCRLLLTVTLVWGSAYVSGFRQGDHHRGCCSVDDPAVRVNEDTQLQLVSSFVWSFLARGLGRNVLVRSFLFPDSVSSVFGCRAWLIFVVVAAQLSFLTAQQDSDLRQSVF